MLHNILCEIWPNLRKCEGANVNAYTNILMCGKYLRICKCGYLIVCVCVCLCRYTHLYIHVYVYMVLHVWKMYTCIKYN